MAKKITYSESLECKNPLLSEEWHSIKNNNLLPSMVFPNSNRKVWWLGKCGHEWESVISHRSKGVGCPYCHNMKVLTGFNDLATTNPDIAAEWHPTKNGDIKPNEICGSKGKVWWLGKCGHEWQQTVGNRKSGQGCPICRNVRIAKSVSKYHINKTGSLAVTHPDIAAEWDPERNTISPYDITKSSQRNVWWKCNKGHEWQQRICYKNKAACPVCEKLEGNDVCFENIDFKNPFQCIRGVNDLETLYPSIAIELHPVKNGDLQACDLAAQSSKKVWWLGKCGHEWQQTVTKRTKQKRNCPFCAKKLQTSFPEQAIFFYIKKYFPDAVSSFKSLWNDEMELDIYIPSLKIAFEYDGSYWHCSEDSRQRDLRKYERCKQKEIQLVRIKEDNFDDDFCDYSISSERHPSERQLEETIFQVLLFLGINEVEINLQKDDLEIRSQYITGTVSKSFIDLHPVLEKDWNYEKNKGLNPCMFSESSGIYVWWKCNKCGYEWKGRIADRTAGKQCVKCSIEKRAKVLIQNRVQREGSLLTMNPEIAVDWHPSLNEVGPEEILPGSCKKYWWKCHKCGYEWQTTAMSRKRGSKCPNCRRLKKQLGSNQQ